MSQLNGITELLELIDECLANEDWERLERIPPPSQRGVLNGSQADLEEALSAVHEMQSRVKDRMEQITAQLEAAPKLRQAARAYLGGH